MKRQSDQILLMNGTIACRMEKREAADKPMSPKPIRVVQLKFHAFVQACPFSAGWNQFRKSCKARENNHQRVKRKHLSFVVFTF